MNNKPRALLFLEKVAVGDDCWEWQAERLKGYGRFRSAADGQGTKLAHRFAYELLVGPIPAGMELDHLCRNRACVRPDHLEPVSSRINNLRGLTIAARNAAKTHCSENHPLSGDNLYVRPDRPRSRECRTCHRAALKRAVLSGKPAPAPPAQPPAGEI